MISISVTSEFIRLHRPWLRELSLIDLRFLSKVDQTRFVEPVLSGENKTFQYSRDQAIKHSKILLAVYRSPSCNKQKWGGMTYKATNAAIVLAIDILAFPDQAEVELLRSTIKAVQKQMESQSTASVSLPQFRHPIDLFSLSLIPTRLRRLERLSKGKPTDQVPHRQRRFGSSSEGRTSTAKTDEARL
jgi:hypothetical protein